MAMKQDAMPQVARFRVEGGKSDPADRDDRFREEIADHQPRAQALDHAREFHARGLWVEIFSARTGELLAGPFDPDSKLPRHFLFGA